MTSSLAAQQNAFLELLEQHKTILFKIARLYCRDRADVADVVQEITLQAWRSFSRYDHSRPFSTWLYRIGLNVAISFYRTEARRSRLLVPADESIIEIAAPPSEAAALAEELRLLHNYISQFDELDKALVMLYLDGQSNDAIADVLGISVSNVSTRVHRIKRKLRRQSLEKGILAWTSMM